MITNEAAEKLLSDMVRIESVTPWLIPDGAGEAACASFVADWVADLPVEASLVEIAPGRVNTLVRLPGSGGGPTLCVNAHIDTVGYANWRDRALTPAVDGDIMVGLGAADDKAGCVGGAAGVAESSRRRTRPSAAICSWRWWPTRKESRSAPRRCSRPRRPTR